MKKNKEVKILNLVRILEPTRNIPYITVPNRSCYSNGFERSRFSRYDSGASAAIGNKLKMFDRLAQAENALNASCHGLSVPFAHR